MRDRLASLSEEARTIRGQVPREFEPDVERIQQQMQRLGERLSELNNEARAQLGLPKVASRPPVHIGEAPHADPDEVIMLGGPANEAGAWDRRSMDALSRIYESGEAFSTAGQQKKPAAPTAMAAPAPARDPAAPSAAEASRALAPLFPDFEKNHRAGQTSADEGRAREAQPGMNEPEWLDRRFAEIAERIEQSLSEIRPENSLLTLSRRFDDFEVRITAALKGMATRTDLDELRIAESQIDDISLQLDQLRRQLARLDAIDSHLGTLSSQLSDERLARLISQGAGVARLEAIDAQLLSIANQLSNERLSGLFRDTAGRGSAADIESVANAAAERTAQRFAGQEQNSAQAQGIGEVRGLIESLINERRHHDENNASMLETMQQAIIRVLDRIDALEIVHSGVGAGDTVERAPEAADAYAPAQTQQHEHGEPQPEYGYEPLPTESFFGEQDEPPPVPQAQAEKQDFVPVPFDLDQAFASERTERSEPYGADAPAPQPEPQQVEMLRHDFIADAHKAKLKAASKTDSALAIPMAEPKVADVEAKPKKARAKRSIFRSPRMVMMVLTLLAAIPAAIFFMPRTPADGAAVPAVVEVPPLSSETGRATTGSATGQPGAGQIDSDDAGAPASGTPDKQSRNVDPSGGQFEDAGSPAMHPGRAMMDTGSNRQAAVGTTPPLMTAALVQEGADVFNATTPADMAPTKASRLPPATVGPYSLRLAAAQGDPSAQFEVGMRLGGAKGNATDLKESAQWYERAASNGFAMAQFRLGTLYERGIGVAQDYARAQVWYGRAAEQGNLKAMHNLAVLVASRSDAKPDYVTAAKWFTEAAERGLGDSQYNLAVLYENGLGVNKDIKAAYKWLSLAAKSGDADAASRLKVVTAHIDAKDRKAAEADMKAFRAKPVDRIANDARIAGQAWRREHGVASNG